MKRLTAVLMTTIFLTSSTSYADITIQVPQVPANEQPVGQVISPLKKGQAAPYTGVLLSPEAVAKVVVDYNNLKAESKIEAERARAEQEAKDKFIISELKADLKQEKAVAAAQITNRNEQIKILNQRLAETESARKDTLWWTAGGAVVGLVGAALVAVAVGLAN